MHLRYVKYIPLLLFFFCFVGYKAYQMFALGHMKRELAERYVDFDASMQQEKYAHYLKNQFSGSTYEMFKGMYAKNNFLKVQPQYAVKIPKIIHQIWLGSPFPEEYKAYQESWRRHHPGWEYKLWTDADVAHLKLVNQDLYDASVNYGERSDILRYELLYRYGGLYADTDFECLKPLDLLHHCYDFYIGIQPLDTSYSQLGIGLMGSVPGHPLLEKCIKHIRNNTDVRIVTRTGPIHCTTMFYHYAGKGPLINVALPASYFYPCGYEQKGLPSSTWRQPESFAVHHWAASWMKKEGFVKKGFQTRM